MKYLSKLSELRFLDIFASNKGFKPLVLREFRDSLKLHVLRVLCDSIWLLALGVFVVVGMPIATFHGDEAMQIYMSHDYATAFIDRDPARLMVSPPYAIDSDPQLRIINGSVNRYAIGLSWHLAGFTADDLPPAPGWDWGLHYDINVVTNHRPPDALLHAARMSSALFLVASVVIVFALGWKIGGALTAYVASGLYALHSVILLNGRRAMMEGSLLCFGLLTVLVAVVISRRRAADRPIRWYWWLGLSLAAGLALASKHSAIVFVVGAFAWIFAVDLLRHRWRPLLATVGRLCLCFVGAAALFVALSPALWNDPIARFQDLLMLRQQLLDIQVSQHTTGAMTPSQRVEQIVTQPFLQPLQHFEAEGFSDSAPYMEEVARYMASPLSGIQFGTTLGGMLTALASVGILAALWRWRRGDVFIAGLLAWLGVVVLSLLANPLPWQRYYLLLIPLAALLVGGAVRTIISLVANRL